MNSSLRILFPVSTEPVRSSRLIHSRFPYPHLSVARAMSVKGVGDRAKFRRGGYSIGLDTNGFQRALGQHRRHMDFLKLELDVIPHGKDEKTLVEAADLSQHAR